MARMEGSKGGQIAECSDGPAPKPRSAAIRSRSPSSITSNARTNRRSVSGRLRLVGPMDPLSLAECCERGSTNKRLSNRSLSLDWTMNGSQHEGLIRKGNMIGFVGWHRARRLCCVTLRKIEVRRIMQVHLQTCARKVQRWERSSPNVSLPTKFESHKVPNAV
jgi:hypothetical protein